MLKKLFIFLVFTVLLIMPARAQDENGAANQLTFLQQMFFENQGHQFDSFLIDQFQNFLRQNPNYKQNDQILWMYGKILEDQKNITAALIQYLKICLLYPKGNLAPEAKSHIQQMLAQKPLICLVDCQQPIESYLNTNHYFENQTEALFNVFHFIFNLNLSCFDQALLNDLILFEESCKENDYPGDILLYWKGFLQKRLKKFSAAYGHFKKLESLFPQSSLMPTALFESSMLAYRQFKRYEQARDGFIRLINHFPGEPQSALAQFYLAELYENVFDSLNTAIDNYRLFLDAFPDHPLALKAFKRLTFLYFKTDRYEEAITLLGVNLNKHGSDSTVVVLIDSMANVLEKKFKKYEFAARSYILLASQLPTNEQTPYYLYRAARIYLKFLKDTARARDICNRLSKNFAESPYAEKCKLLLKQAIKK